ncbi:MAG: choice-of-anchor tandem repeat GloVer-containing protein [Limisphaerales bacterium]
MKAELKPFPNRPARRIRGSRLANPKRAPGTRPALALLARLLLAATLALPTLNVFAAGVLTVIHTFGRNPDYDASVNMPGLIQGADGYLYGLTFSDAGAYDRGSAFKISVTGAFTLLHSFTGGSDGGTPWGALVQASNGFFYGTTFSGGANNYGTVFQMSASGGFVTVRSFIDGMDGWNPIGALVQGSDGYLYGTTYSGGTNTCGTVFKITTNGTLTSLYSFTNGLDGANPWAGVVQGTDGNFYGTASAGGAYSNGTVFKITSTGAFTPLHSFRGGSDGKTPYGALMLASNGNFYGTTSGQNGAGPLTSGTVFAINSTGSLTTVGHLGGGGQGPQAGLAQGSDGRFYGTVPGAISASPNGGGVFSVGAGGDFITLYQFTNGLDGAFPETALVQATDGNFYGMANYGGPTTSSGIPQGTIFRVSPGDEPPWIVTQPVSISASNGTAASFAVQAAGTPPLAYQWQRNGTNLADSLGVFGVASSILSLTVAGDDAGSYDVIVSNAYGSVTSLVASLTVLGPNVPLVPIPVTIYAPPPEGGLWTLGFPTALGQSYTIQRNSDLSTTNWVTYTTLIGDGLWVNFEFPATSPPADFFRVLEPPD